MNLIRVIVPAVWILAAPLLAADAEPSKLDVSRIALFSSGVGYFERAATVAGDTTAELNFRTDQINDIIKSMVVQDLGGGHVGVVSYASQDPIEKTLRSFGVDLTGKPTLGQLLDQLRGEPVELSGSRTLSGIIVGVEKAPVYNTEGQVIEQIERLTVLTDTGLQQLPLTKLDGIKLTNDKIAAELRKALATLATGHDADKKSVTLRFEGSGERPVRVAYLLEAPIWKTSYRLVLSDDDKPFLQGWATVENATEEDWNNVRLSLVSGRPISFRMDLYTPLYVPRPLEQLDLYASLRPPDYDAAFAGREEQRENKSVERLTARRMTAGRAAATAEMAAEQESSPTGGMPELDAFVNSPTVWGGYYESGGGGVASVAEAREAGELFEYRIDTPVSIPRQHSAMLPIVNQAVEAQKISIFNAATHPTHPLNGLELTNSTKLNLRQGPITVFEGGIYAGDAKLPDLKPGEKRLLAYALDLGTEVLTKSRPQQDELVSLKIAKGVLLRQRKQSSTQEYQIKNKLDRERTILIEYPYSDDWKLIEPTEPYEKTRGLLRFKVTTAANETTTFPVRVERIIDQTVILTSIGLDEIQMYLRARTISPEVKAALERVVALRTELDDLARRRAALEQQRDEAIREQARIRDNLKTLDRNTDAYARQIKIFNEVDERILKLGTDIDQARQAEDRQRKALEDYLLSLNVE